MGVMECCRSGCEEILCDRMILGNYICNVCMEELLRLKASWPESMRGSEVEPAVREFMATEKGQSDGNTVDVAFQRLLEM